MVTVQADDVSGLALSGFMKIERRQAAIDSLQTAIDALPVGSPDSSVADLSDFLQSPQIVVERRLRTSEDSSS